MGDILSRRRWGESGANFQIFSRQKPMLAPPPALLRGRPQLHRVNRLRPLQHHALEEVAELADGQRILELGCGWGSLSLWMAEKYPGAQITAVSNSRTQKEHIDAEAAKRGFKNLTIHSCGEDEARECVGFVRYARECAGMVFGLVW